MTFTKTYTALLFLFIFLLVLTGAIIYNSYNFYSSVVVISLSVVIVVGNIVATIYTDSWRPFKRHIGMGTKYRFYNSLEWIVMCIPVANVFYVISSLLAFMVSLQIYHNKS